MQIFSTVSLIVIVMAHLLLVFTATGQLISENTIEEPADDKGLSDYLSWWQSILGISTATDEPDVVVTPVDLKTCPPCECGVSKKVRIVGGHTVQQANMYPWMTQLLYKGRFYCGGSLINNRYILTAAHCVHHFDKKHMSVRLMDHDRTSSTDTVVIERRVDRVIKHKSYSVSTFNNDIALIRMNEEINFTRSGPLQDDKPSPVCLPVEGKSFAGSKGLVVGWGTTKAGGSPASVLNEVEVPIISNDECKKTGYGEKRITPNMMCAGIPEGGKDSCQGDSGGPLKITNSSNMFVVGVVSWGEGCAEKNYPGVYARVNRYLNWIHNYTADACPCPYKKPSDSS